MAPRTKPCPECGDPIASYRKSCECGWTEAAKKGERSAKCSVADCHRPWSIDGKCSYHHRLPQGADAILKWRKELVKYSAEHVRQSWAERHADDVWGALYRASHSVEDADFSEFIGMLKKSMGDIGKLPYNPATIEPERDAYGQ